MGKKENARDIYAIIMRLCNSDGCCERDKGYSDSIVGQSQKGRCVWWPVGWLEVSRKKMGKAGV